MANKQLAPAKLGWRYENVPALKRWLEMVASAGADIVRAFEKGDAERCEQAMLGLYRNVATMHGFVLELRLRQESDDRDA